MLFLLSSAQARAVDEAELARMVRDLQPQVEAVAGRSFETLPRVQIDDRAHVRAMLTARPSYLPATLWEPDLEGTDALLDKALAIYGRNSDTIYVLSDAMREAFRTLDADSDLVRPILQCVVAHELAHALQYRHVAGPFLVEEPRDKVLLEGHASWVARQVCPEAGLAAHAAITGEELAPSADRSDPDVYAYLLGDVLTDTYVARYGKEAWWWRMEQGPPTPEAVQAIADAGMVRGWNDPAPYLEVLRTSFGLDGALEDVTLPSPYLLLKSLGAGGSAHPSLRVHPSASIHAEALVSGQGFATTYTWLLRSEAEARSLVDNRRIQANPGFGSLMTLSPTRMYLTSALRNRPLPARRTPAGVSATLWLEGSVDDGSTYQEVWLARGPVVWVLAWRGERDNRGLFAAVDGIVGLPLELQPVGVDGVPAARDALAAMAPPEPLPTPLPSALWITGQIDVDQPEACLEAAVRGLERSTSRGRATLAQVGIHCATRLERVEAIERLAATEGLGEDREDVVISAVIGLVELRAYVAAERASAGVEPEEPDRRALVRAARLMGAADRHDWERVRAGFRDVEVGVDFRGYAAARMAEAGKVKEAMVVLREICGEQGRPEWCSRVSGLR